MAQRHPFLAIHGRHGQSDDGRRARLARSSWTLCASGQPTWVCTGGLSRADRHGRDGWPDGTGGVEGCCLDAKGLFRYMILGRLLRARSANGNRSKQGGRSDNRLCGCLYACALQSAGVKLARQIRAPQTQATSGYRSACLWRRQAQPSPSGPPFSRPDLVSGRFFFVLFLPSPMQVSSGPGDD